MSILVSLLFVSIFSLDYLAVKLELVSKYVTLFPELLSIVIFLIMVGQALVNKSWYQPYKYIFLILALISVGMIGAVAESVDPLPLISGMREYFKFFPLFFVSAAIKFSKRDLHIIIGSFLFLAAIQVPLAFYQRFVQFAGSMHTGDPVTGTVATSSSLTVILCLAIAIIMTMYVNRRISFSMAAVLFLYFAAPTAINETKATIILLPIATVGPFLLARNVTEKWKTFVPVIGLCTLGLVAYVLVYNTLIEARWWGGSHQLGDFLTSGQLQTYLYQGTTTGSTSNVIGRLDSIALPITVLSENWMQFLFGLGPGNVSPAFIPEMEGRYYQEYRGYGVGMTSIGNLLWELGIVGLGIYVSLFYCMWRDAQSLAKSETDFAWLGNWWSVSVIILFISLFYKNILNFSEIGYLLFFFSGVVAAQRKSCEVSIVTKDTPQVADRPRLSIAGKSQRAADGSVG